MDRYARINIMPELPEVETIRLDLESYLLKMKPSHLKFLIGACMSRPECSPHPEPSSQKLDGFYRKGESLPSGKLEGEAGSCFNLRMTGQPLVDARRLAESGMLFDFGRPRAGGSMTQRRFAGSLAPRNPERSGESRKPFRTGRAGTRSNQDDSFDS